MKHMFGKVLNAALSTSLKAVLPKLHTQYLEKASQYTKKTPKKLLLALQFQQDDMEATATKEKELAMKDKDKELAMKDKDKELAMKDKDKEKELAMKDKDFEKEWALKGKDNEMSLLRSTLSALTQR